MVEKRGIFTKVCTFHVTFEFGASVLEPGDDLGVGQTQRQGDLVSIGRWQVLLIEEALLQLENLVVGEGRPRFPLLLGLLARTEQLRVTRRVTWKQQKKKKFKLF